MTYLTNIPTSLQVPDVFFRSDFSLTSPEVFAQTLMGGSDKASAAAATQLLTQLKHQQHHPQATSSSSSSLSTAGEGSAASSSSGSRGHNNSHQQQQLCHINAQYQPQQERLSRYLDIVEINTSFPLLPPINVFVDYSYLVTAGTWTWWRWLC